MLYFMGKEPFYSIMIYYFPDSIFFTVFYMFDIYFLDCRVCCYVFVIVTSDIKIHIYSLGNGIRIFNFNFAVDKLNVSSKIQICNSSQDSLNLTKEYAKIIKKTYVNNSFIENSDYTFVHITENESYKYKNKFMIM